MTQHDFVSSLHICFRLLTKARQGLPEELEAHGGGGQWDAWLRPRCDAIEQLLTRLKKEDERWKAELSVTEIKAIVGSVAFALRRVAAKSGRIYDQMFDLTMFIAPYGIAISGTVPVGHVSDLSALVNAAAIVEGEVIALRTLLLFLVDLCTLKSVPGCAPAKEIAMVT